MYPVIEHIRRVVRLDRHDSPEAALTKLERALQGLACCWQRSSRW
jgi:hypothetical protein